MKDKERQPHLQQCCTLSLSHESEEGTCCGILIDSRQGLVLSHASLLSSFLKPNSSVHHDINDHGYSNNSELSKFKIRVLFQEEKGDVSSTFSVVNKLQPNLLTSEQDDLEGFAEFDASIKCIFQCWSLKQIITKLLPAENWDFSQNVSDIDEGSERLDNKVKENNKSTYYKFMPCFLLLRMQNWEPYDNVINIKPSFDNCVGDRVEVQATPFGSVSPEVFFNSRSQGIISNLAGRNQVLILTDSRCIPGSEGGPLYYCEGRNRTLTGIIVATLCWKNNEWIGLSLAAALSEVLDDLSRLPLKIYEQVYLPHKTIDRSWLSSLHRRTSEKIPLVSIGGTWGSGILLGQNKRGQAVVLTCSHVVRAAEKRTVKVTYKPTSRSFQASVVYKTPVGHQFDLAVLVHDIVPKFSTMLTCWETELSQEGDPLYVIGYGLFGEKYDLQPTLTSGVVSKIITVKNHPVILQTTCAVHAGASGGAVINCSGKVVGIAVCNARDSITGSSYPHVNMCVPMVTILPVLEKYMKTNDEKVLQQLHNHNTTVQRLWTLEKVKGGTPLLTSKL